MKTKNAKTFISNKQCTSCGGFERYISNMVCAPCKKKESRDRYNMNREKIISQNSEWAKKNKDKTREYKKSYKENNKEKLLESNRLYRENNPEKVKESKASWISKNPEYMREYRERNIERITANAKAYAKAHAEENRLRVRVWRSENIDKVREMSREYMRRWRKTNEGKSVTFMRGCIARCVYNRKFGKRTSDLLGYTHEDLTTHIERQFEKWMSWDNYGKKWCIDHIVPIKHFLSIGVKDPSVINALSNLRPICIKENSRKSAELYFLL